MTQQILLGHREHQLLATAILFYRQFGSLTLEEVEILDMVAQALTAQIGLLEEMPTVSISDRKRKSQPKKLSISTALTSS